MSIHAHMKEGKRERAREEVAILLNNVWHSAVVNFGTVRSRILWIKFKFQRLTIVWWWGTAPVKKMMKKGTDSGTTWRGEEIVQDLA